jgi:uncharacterized protein
MRRITIVFTGLVLMLLTLQVGVAEQAGSYGVTVSKDVMVPMRDGTGLATDVYLPTRDGVVPNEKLPCILMRQPYNKGEVHPVGTFYASHGYGVVIQDTRGRYKSEGVWHMLTDDGRDGSDTAAWIERQPWSDGQIGMIGTSYFGGTQHAMALEKTPQLKTVIPVDAMANLGYASMRNGGAFELRFWNWILLNSARGSRASRDPATRAVLQEMVDNRLLYLENLPLLRGTTPLQLAPEYEDWLVEGMRHGANDDFWRQNNILDYIDDYKDIPVYLVGGWYDSWGSNTTATFTALSSKLKSAVYLIMGPWIHNEQHRYAHGQVSFGKEAGIAEPLTWRLEWYDRWLKGKDNKVGKSAPFATPVRIFVMGTGDGSRDAENRLSHGGYWRDEEEWPLKRTQYTPYFVHKDGTLSTHSPRDQNSSTSFNFDPYNPVPTIGGNISSGDGILVAGAWDQRGSEQIWNWKKPIPLSARPDVLVFQTEPLSEDLEVTGEIQVKLFVSSSALDTDFTAKLIDVYPSSPGFPGGFDLIIGDGIRRMRFRDSLGEEELMTPNEVYETTVHLYPTSNVFKKGHRIRIDISSSNFPRFDVNPNSGEPLNQHRRKVVATNTIHHDQSRPSRIILPVIPRAAR